jgi:thiol-disulfide isomerase/thioredoxin
MLKPNNVLLNLCLSSLVFAVAMATTTAAGVSAPESPSSLTRIAGAPCAGKPNPCAGKPNPCAAKPNPCAGKPMASVGGPLAQKLQGKPVLVDIYASWCPGCKNIAPTLSQLKQDYAGKVNFVVLDVTDPGKLRASEAMAKELGLANFLRDNKSKTSMVAIIDPATGKILASYKNNANKADYAKILNAAIAAR